MKTIFTIDKEQLEAQISKYRTEHVSQTTSFIQQEYFRGRLEAYEHVLSLCVPVSADIEALNISDEEIEKLSNNFYETEDFKKVFQTGAKFMRDKISAALKSI